MAVCGVKRESWEGGVDSINKQNRLSSAAAAPVRLCSIYLRDPLSFLPRKKIDELRIISRAFNYTVESWPSSIKLPRRVYPYLLDVRHNSLSHPSCGFKSPWECCGAVNQDEGEVEKKDAGRELEDHLIFLNHDGKSQVCFTVMDIYSLAVEEVAWWCYPNKLTVESAGSLLCLLSHLDGCVVEKLYIETDPTTRDEKSGEPMGVLNPKLADVYRKTMGGGEKLRIYTLSARPFTERQNYIGMMKTACQLMGTRLGCLSVLIDEVPEAIALICTSQPYCLKLKVSTSPRYLNSQDVDTIINYFKEYDGSFKTLVPEVDFWRAELYDWPNSCPKNARKTVVETRDEWLGREYGEHILPLTNVASGQQFRASFGMGRDIRTGSQTIYSMKLNFNHN